MGLKSSTGFTVGTLQQDALNICENVVRTINAKMVDVLLTSKLLKTVDYPKLTGSLLPKAEAIVDALFESTESAYGSEVSSYGILAHESHMSALSRLAMKNGFGGEDAVKDMLGTDIAYYNGTDRGLFMLAKQFTCLSFGCLRHDGEHITVVLSVMATLSPMTLRFSVRYSWSLRLLLPSRWALAQLLPSCL